MKKILACIMCTMAILPGLLANGNGETQVSEQKETVKVLITYPKEKEILYQCFDDFTKETGIDVELIYMPLNDSRKQISIMVAGNDLPDVLDVDNPDTSNYAQMGILADVTDRVKAEIETDKYYPGALSTNMYEGKYYGLPFTSNNLCLYYNKDLFEKAGATVPATWDELLEACKKLSAIGVNAFGVAGAQTSDTTFQMWPFIWGAGVDYTHMDSPETVKMLNFYKTLIDNKYMSKEVIQYSAGESGNQFIAQKVAMIVDGPWRLSSIYRSGADLNFGVTLIPDGGAGPKTALGGHNFAITNGDNVDAAWAFVKYMNRPDVMLKYSQAENYIPARKDVCESADYYKNEPISIFARMANYAQQLPLKNYSKLSEQINLMWQSVVLGTKTPEQAAQDAQKAIAPLL